MTIPHSFVRTDVTDNSQYSCQKAIPDRFSVLSPRTQLAGSHVPLLRQISFENAQQSRLICHHRLRGTGLLCSVSGMVTGHTGGLCRYSLWPEVTVRSPLLWPHHGRRGSSV